MENQSIYNRIKSAMLPDGTLPEEFVLRQQPEQGMRFADGAMDGTIRYHMGPTENPDISGLTMVLEMASQERFRDAANALVTHFNNGGMMLPVVDALQDWIYDHTEKLSPEALGRFVVSLLMQSQDVESVKFALTVLEVLDLEMTDEMLEVLLVLAASEELTLFCLFIFSGLDDGNKIIYSLAKKLKGWGKIHAVSMLNPENAEITNWLLREGWRNNIMPEYSSMTAIKRGKLLSVISKPDVTKDDFSLAGELIDVSLDDGPIPGLAAYKKTRELFEVYLALAEKYAAELRDYSAIYDIRDFLGNSQLQGKEKLINKCSSLLDSQSCKKCVELAMDSGEGFYLGKVLGLDYAPRAMETLRREWETKYDIIDMLLRDRCYVDEIISLFEDVLPLEEMAEGPTNELGNSEENREYGILSYVVQGLQQVPGKGEKLICAGLYSPVVGCRNIALNTVQKWMEKDYQLTPAMKEVISRLKKTEVHEATRKRLEKF